jgi:hypothetical protein
MGSGGIVIVRVLYPLLTRALLFTQAIASAQVLPRLRSTKVILSLLLEVFQVVSLIIQQG